MSPAAQPESTVARSGVAQGRVTKRSSNACSRCRRQKIKCTGQHPCQACSRRKLTCHFDDYDQKILVNKGYLISLQQKLAALERQEEHGTDNATHPSLHPTFSAQHNDPGYGTVQDAAVKDLPSEDSLCDPALADNLPNDPIAELQTPPLQASPFGDGTRDIAQSDVGASDAGSLSNPLSTGPSSFMTSKTGRSFYLGTSSNWSFTRRILSMTHEFVHRSPISSENLLFDGETYDVSLGGDDAAVRPSSAVPTIDYAIHLVNAVKFHCGQLFHVFDDESFMRNLYDFYAEPRQETPRTDLWYIHFLLVLAFGKAFVTKTSRGRRPPGANFFSRAIQLLPDASVLYKTPIEATEILCCVSMYFQCTDHRSSAYNYIGQAVRLAMSQGMHTNMPPEQLSEATIQRCRKIWWTVYVLDREMTSLMGLPQAVRDEDVYAPLPTTEGDAFRIAAFKMRIKLSQFVAKIDRTVYAADGRPQRDFLPHTKEALSNIAEITDELQLQFPLLIDDEDSCVSRLSAHLHLLYHQCIVLATRPLLFCLYRIRLDSLQSSLELLQSSQPAQNLLNMCLDSSQQIVTILGCVHNQGLLETFLPFDLEALVISATNILIAPTIDPQAKASLSSSAHRAFIVFDEISRSGNLISQTEQLELQNLSEMVDTLCSGQAAVHGGVVMADAVPADTPSRYLLQDGTGLDNGNSVLALEDDLMGAGFSASQIMDMVNSINHDQSEWMLEEVVERVL